MTDNTMPTDTEMLDWLQAQNDRNQYTGHCKFRKSASGRGWRLHETSRAGASSSVRTAITNAIIVETLRLEARP